MGGMDTLGTKSDLLGLLSRHLFQHLQLVDLQALRVLRHCFELLSRLHPPSCGLPSPGQLACTLILASKERGAEASSDSFKSRRPTLPGTGKTCRELTLCAQIRLLHPYPHRQRSWPPCTEACVLAQ